MSVMLVVSASARTLAPSSPTLLTMNVQHRQIQHTKAEKKNTLKVQRRERRVGLECISEGIGTVGTDVVPYERPQTDSAN